jgi:maleate cis-trans isomerase
MPSLTWRGTVGVIKPTYESGSLVEFIRLLPEGIGVIPLYLGLKEYTAEEFLAALETYHVRVAELAEKGVDLIHPEGAPPFLLRGYQAEQEIVKAWQEQYKIPIFTSAMTQTAAFRAMGIKRLLGVTYLGKNVTQMFARYFIEAGFDVAAMETVPVERARRYTISAEEIYSHIKKMFLEHSNVDGIYLLGSGTWRAVDVVPLEEDLGVPVIHPVAARVWYIQKQLHVREPIQGVGRLLEKMP